MSTFDDIIKQKQKIWNAPDMMNPASRGDKIPFSSPLLNWSTYGGIPRDKITEFFGQPGGGKAQPLYSKILTPSGWKTMREMRLGDIVFDGQGSQCSVDGVFPQGVRAIYEIELSDKTSFRVADNHLNSVWWYDRIHCERVDEVLTTEELIEKKEILENTWCEAINLNIDVPKVDWPHNEVKIDPYLLGALIGCSNLSDTLSFTCDDLEVVSKIDGILRRDWDCILKQSKSDKFIWRVRCLHPWRSLTVKYQDQKFESLPEFQTWLIDNGYKKLDVSTIKKLANGEPCNASAQYPELEAIEIIYNPPSGRAQLLSTLNSYKLICKPANRSIPLDYLYNSEQVRLQLATGLFDSSGYSRYFSHKDIACDWSTFSSQLSQDCQFLFRSLGIIVEVKKYQCKYTDDSGQSIEGHPVYTHYLKLPKNTKIFSSKKHCNSYVEPIQQPQRFITSIKYVGQEECQCIHVSSQHHTYVTDNFTLTHNTTTAVDVCKNASKMFEKEWEDRLVELRELGTKEAKLELAELEDSGPRKILYLDLEHSFDTEWAKTLGIDSEKIAIMQPPDIPAEDILQMVQEMVESNEVGLIVLDSIPSLVPKSVLEKKIGERTVASLAGLLDVFMKKINQLLMRYKTTLLLINQIRDNMDNPYVVNTPGGQAVKFFCGLRMQFTLGNPIDLVGNELPQKTEDPAGYLIKVRLVKQKTSPNDRKNASYYLLSQSGIKPEMDYAQLAIHKYGIIRKAGAWFSLAIPSTGEILEDEGKPVKINGLPRVYEYLETHPEYFNSLKTYIENDINGVEQ